MAEIDLNDLADRVERLEGSDYAIELEIATWCYENGSIAGVNYDPRMWLERNGGGFTYSIDAAMTLVPEGCAWSLYSDGPTYKASAEIGKHPSGGELMQGDWIGEGETPALALCCAALRARLMEGEGE